VGERASSTGEEQDCILPVGVATQGEAEYAFDYFRMPLGFKIDLPPVVHPVRQMASLPVSPNAMNPPLAPY
jgi:hypothetical protein